MAEFEVSFTVETESLLDEWVNDANERGSSVAFYSTEHYVEYCIPAKAVVKRIVPSFEYGYWRHKESGSVYKVEEGSPYLQSRVQENSSAWERVTVEAATNG